MRSRLATFCAGGLPPLFQRLWGGLGRRGLELQLPLGPAKLVAEADQILGDVLTGQLTALHLLDRDGQLGTVGREGPLQRGVGAGQLVKIQPPAMPDTAAQRSVAVDAAPQGIDRAGWPGLA